MANSKASQSLDIQALSKIDPRVLEDALKNSQENGRIIELEAEVMQLKNEIEQLKEHLKRAQRSEQDAVKAVEQVIKDLRKTHDRMTPRPMRMSEHEQKPNRVNQFGTQTQTKIRRVAREKGVSAEDIVEAYKAGTLDLDKEIEDITGNKAPVKRSPAALDAEIGDVVSQVQGNMPT